MISWELFWFSDKEDFQNRLAEFPDFVRVSSDRFVLFGTEKIYFQVMIGGNKGCPQTLSVRRGNKELPVRWENGVAVVEEEPRKIGEYSYEILWKGESSKAVFNVLPDLEQLVEKRCRFLVEHQQCHDKKSRLNGAFLIYDNEEKQQYYGHRNDHNGGRERVGMGVLLALWLQDHPNREMKEALDSYMDYVLRELFDLSTGRVYNDIGRQDVQRLYNYPTISLLFLEMYKLEKKTKYLVWYCRTIEELYREGGKHFYGIGIPMYESIRLLEEAKMKEEAEKILTQYKEHGDFIMECGRNYPMHEVDYEQSIVAPAAIYMYELYYLTGEEKYRKEALKQMELLDLFQGFQPDYHLNEVAIRHWDDYWFGKRRLLGDTFPHYWSVLSGYAEYLAAGFAEAQKYSQKCEQTLRGTLSLFNEDGSASCAMVYPMSVNGKAGAFYDPWANDQDWGLYYILKCRQRGFEKR